VVFEVTHRFGDELLLWDSRGATDGGGDRELIDEIAALLMRADAGDEAAETALARRYRAAHAVARPGRLRPHRALLGEARDRRARTVTADRTSRIDARLAAARARLARIEPATAASRRPRRAGRRVVVVEWRLDPTSAARIEDVAQTTPVIVFCQQGCTSSLLASDPLDLGRADVTDIVGGFEAWRDAGLPVVDGGRPADFS